LDKKRTKIKNINVPDQHGAEEASRAPEHLEHALLGALLIIKPNLKIFKNNSVHKSQLIVYKNFI
jgi:hypothetical protein